MQVKKFTYLLSLLILSVPISAENHTFCNFTMTVRQYLQQDGFHRNLTYEIIFVNHDDKANAEYFLYDPCMVGLIQVLPAGLFTNSDELNELRRTEKLTAFPDNIVNVELAAEYAQPVTAYIYAQVSYSKVVTWLPVHARYHKAVKGGGYAHNEIEAPGVYIRCADNRMAECGQPMVSKTYLCEESPDTCLWRKLDAKMLNKPLDWSVPVGNLDHYYSMVALTMASIVIGSLGLMKTIHSHKIVCYIRTRKA